MATYMKETTRMGFQKGMDSIPGRREQPIKDNSSKASKTVTVFGRKVTILCRFIRVTICLIRGMDMEFTIGVMGMYIKDSFQMTLEMDWDSFIYKGILCIRVFG